MFGARELIVELGIGNLDGSELTFPAAKLAPITILTEPIGSILRLAGTYRGGQLFRVSNRMESKWLP